MLQSIYIIPSSPLYLPKFQSQYHHRLYSAITAYNTIIHDIVQKDTDTLIIISSKASMIDDRIHLFAYESLYGSCEKYYHSELSFQATCDSSFVKSLLALAKHNHIPVSTKKEKNEHLDIGCMMPIHLLNKYSKKEIQIVCISTSNISFNHQHMFGQCIYECAMQSEKNYTLLLSVESSHSLNNESLYGQTKEGILFDKQCLQALQQQTFTPLYQWSKDSLQLARQNILSAIMMLDGVLSSDNFISQYIHYDTNFGIGHIFYKFTTYDEDPYIDVVRKTLWSIYKKEPIKINICSKSLTSTKFFGLFIRIFYNGSSIYETGSSSLLNKNWKEYLIYCTKKVFHNLPEPLKPHIYDLEIQIDFLKDCQPVLFPEDIIPKTHGLIIKYKGKQYILFPSNDKKLTGKQYITQALTSFNIHMDDFYILESFFVEKHHS